ncbi:AlbA family DNA-binding domain-containing protein [Gaopeijia maritima]|uniref:ATP-binding protein n=1 Tax=Gaopeijia maritima TaxID=3119007 RepID=A0ABU9EAC7_9BACT
MIADKSLESVEESDLSALVENRTREGPRLDLKRDQYTWNDAGTREFLADVTSFANSHGGILLIGVDEEDGCASALVGLEGDLDAEIQRMMGKLTDGVDPRLQGCEVRAIPLASGRSVLAVRVPRSWNGPHMVTFKNLSRFFSRNSAGKYQLDVRELRGQFAASDTLAERLRVFRIGRLSDLDADIAPVPLETGPKLILHSIPLSAFDPVSRIEVPAIGDVNRLMRPIKSVGGWSWRNNFDGLLTFSNEARDRMSTYVQLYRTGILEAVDCRLLRAWEGDRVIVAGDFEEEIIAAIERFMSLQRYVGLLPPTMWTLTLTGVRGYRMVLGRLGRSRNDLIDRETLMVPEVMQDDRGRPAQAIARELVDPVWQACGWERSINFDDDGNWRQA